MKQEKQIFKCWKYKLKSTQEIRYYHIDITNQEQLYDDEQEIYYGDDKANLGDIEILDWKIEKIEPVKLKGW